MSIPDLSGEKPVWWQEQAPLGSAVRAVLGLSGFISHVELQLLLKGRSKRKLALGRTEGDGFAQEFVAKIRGPDGKLVAKLRVRSIFEEGLGSELKEKIMQVAVVLESHWPEIALPR